MNNVTIKKATIKDNNYLSVEYTEQQPDGFSTIKKECKIPVHDDLKLAFSALSNHLANLTFQHDKKGKLCYESTACKGFSIGGNGDSEGVTLTGVRTLDSDKSLNISSPFQRFDSDLFDYKHMDDLIEKINICKYEVIEYLFNGKHAPENQLAMPFDELEEENIQLEKA